MRSKYISFFKMRIIFALIVILLVGIKEQPVQAGGSVFGIHSPDPEFFLTGELLGRPTDQSVTVNIVPLKEMEIYFEYGTESGNYTNQTTIYSVVANNPLVAVIHTLQPDTRYYYRTRYCKSGSGDFLTGDEHTFHTQRLEGSSFTFCVEADPHLDEQSNPELQEQTLINIQADQPDFILDLGDTFMSDKLADKTDENIIERHLLMRSFFDRICHSHPLFLVIGNHEGELGWYLDGTADNLAVRTANIRKQYYPNPFPDVFYSGNTQESEFVGLNENYYAFSWGNALFVVLDPYWYTTVKPGKSGDNWDWTLGEDQYFWLRRTLETSNKTFKFVFAHQLVGGGDTEGRGGSEYAHLYEMGGFDTSGVWTFDQRRPGWDKPIHQLFVENKVTIFFHGHDHFFAKQERDGVIYQLVPQPSHPNYKNAGQALAYGYNTGAILPNSGHLRISVSVSEAVVDYVRAYVAEDENPAQGRINGQVDYSYLIPAVPSTGLKTSDYNPENFTLNQNYPNPFNPITRIAFTLPTDVHVILEIYNSRGQKIETILSRPMQAGHHIVDFNGHDLPSGVYFYKIVAGNFQAVKKAILLN